MKLGLVGGVSPFAFCDIYSKICMDYRELSLEYPEIVVFSVRCSVKDELNYIGEGVKGESAIENELIKACEFFAKNNIEIVGICCNSLSNDFKKIAQNFNFKKILTPIDSTIEQIDFSKKYYVFGTNYTSTNRLYGDNVNYLNESDQKIVNEILLSKTSGVFSSVINNRIKEIVNRNKIANIILGCTDFIKDDFIDSGVNILDASTLFIKKCVEVLKCVE